MPAFIDLSGKRFGRLVALRREGTAPSGQPIWVCKCDCGNEHRVRSQSLRDGISKSCGCYNLDVRRAICVKRNTTHGKARTPEHTSWMLMKQRCLNPRTPGFKKYGAKGIKVCESWLKFENFLADMGPKPTREHTLDRWPNNRGNYEPSNCRWATQKEQQNNRTNNLPPNKQRNRMAKAVIQTHLPLRA